MPDTQQYIDSLSGMQWFASIDLKDAFFQIPVKKEHREYTAFSTRTRHVQYTVMPQGLCNSPATFQRLMTKIFQDLPWCKAYIDDLLIPAS